MIIKVIRGLWGWREAGGGLRRASHRGRAASGAGYFAAGLARPRKRATSSASVVQGLAVGGAHLFQQGQRDLAAGQAPGADRAPADQGERAEHAAPDDLRFVRAQHRRAGLPAVQQRVEHAQQPGRRERRFRPCGPGGPIRLAGQPDQAILALVQLGRDGPQPPAGVAQRQSGPFRQVSFGGGGVAGQITTGQPGQRGVSRSAAAGGAPSQSRAST